MATWGDADDSRLPSQLDADDGRISSSNMRNVTLLYTTLFVMLLARCAYRHLRRRRFQHEVHVAVQVNQLSVSDQRYLVQFQLQRDPWDVSYTSTNIFAPEEDGMPEFMESTAAVELAELTSTLPVATPAGGDNAHAASRPALLDKHYEEHATVGVVVGPLPDSRASSVYGHPVAYGTPPWPHFSRAMEVDNGREIL